MSNLPIIELYNIHRSFAQGEDRLVILENCTLKIASGECIALVAPSGAGKSTLLQIAGLLEKPDSGKVIINGIDTTNSNDATRTVLRRDTLGFIYQYHHLLPEFSALENVMLPLLIADKPASTATARATELLAKVGLEKRLKHRPGKLSGGEQQRVAIARALANSPKLLIADEPTGNLDPQTAAHVFDMLMKCVRQDGLALLMATHNHDLANRMDKVITLQNGILQHNIRQ